MTESWTAPAPLDTAAAASIWAQYAAARPSAAQACPDYTVDRFGDSAELADQLLDLVMQGTKRATSAHFDGIVNGGDPLPQIGSHWIVCDGAGVPRVILRTVELRLGAFHSVDEQFAYDEGEDDRSRASWLTEHRKYWQRTCAARGAVWTEDDEIVFERFRVVYPQNLADLDP
ncbi:ASCH domain-containing protein [Actinoplanes sp. NPDC049118]|uniref:ASCH domain-containing protein n=1 Tax=Actinoplanes sp. NPDC049118 TaxID=3155769 RepID=UPI0033FA5304